MNSYLGLVPLSARVHKRQSRMTRICIILSVFLVTVLFSIADIWIDSEKAEMISKHGNYHILLKNIPAKNAELIGERPDVAAAAQLCSLNYDADKDYYINGRKTVLYGLETAYLTDIRNYPLEGLLPRNDTEIILSADAKSLFSVRTGDKITLNTPAGDFDYTISGFCGDDSQFNEIIDSCCAYMDMEAFHKITDANGESSEPEYYIRFSEEASLRGTIADIREKYALTDETIEENKAVLGLSGASSNETAKNIYPLVAIAFLLILISGVLMISSCINSNVAQKTKFFGMLRCLGASKRQVVHLVRLEALNWCKTAVPAGCILGVITCELVCVVLRLLVKGEFSHMPLFAISIPGIICGIFVGIVTVFISAHSPAKQAAKVSPVAAVSGNADTAGKNRHVEKKQCAKGIGSAEKPDVQKLSAMQGNNNAQKKRRHGTSCASVTNTRLFKVETALGIHHAVSAKKNLILMTGSFALSIILFLVFSACLDIVRNLLPSLSSFAPDVAIISEDNSNSIDKGLIDELSQIPGIKRAFGTMMAPAIPAEINGNAGNIDLTSYDEFMLSESKKSVASGDLSKVYGDSGYALMVFQESSRLDVGDKVKIGNNELEIACVLSFGIGGITGNIPAIVCSEETFSRLTGEQNYNMINAIFTREATENTVNAVRALAGGHTFADRRDEDKTINSSYWVFRVGAYGFLIIISFITVLNIMNSISMSVSARVKQYGAMRAVGMANRQVAKMIAAEAAAYAVCGSIAGLIFGLLLHCLIYEKLIVTHFGGVWKIPFLPIVIILLLVSASCVLAVYAPAKRMSNMEITETINEL
ncbi:MAG: ABC transporter permease [Clostridium sp.]|nr:ABC transporter permease [Clostridium sp.]